jgi:AraC family transcriptional regulator of adaptative response/methylated-DNA-[protein]-cysteine methyltransferase
MEALMHPIDFSQQASDYQRIEKAIKFISGRFKSQPTLDQIAASVHLSRYHFDRLFKRWAGISPIQFMHFLTLDYSKQKLAEAGSLLNTAFDAGLSGPGRLHDLFVNFEAMTPGEFKKRAAGLQIEYGFSHTPFGLCLLATTGRGICHLGFIAPNRRSEALQSLKQTWPAADFRKDTSKVKTLLEGIFDKNRQGTDRPFNLLLKGTNFQIQVWKALLRIPEGWVVSYRDIAAFIGSPKALRAVANAVAINPVAYLIPCHRVIAKSGQTRGYRWGAARKKAIIGWEAATIDP